MTTKAYRSEMRLGTTDLVDNTGLWQIQFQLRLTYFFLERTVLRLKQALWRPEQGAANCINNLESGPKLAANVSRLLQAF